jgi:hypothetical protein
VLVTSDPCEPLLLYLAATNHVVSATLVVEREEQGHAWQNHLNYPGSSAQAITIKATPAQMHFKRNNPWSVG